MESRLARADESCQRVSARVRLQMCALHDNISSMHEQCQGKVLLSIFHLWQLPQGCAPTARQLVYMTPDRAPFCKCSGLGTGMSGDMDVFAQTSPEGFLASLGNQEPALGQPRGSRLVTTGNNAAQPAFPTDAQLPGMPSMPQLPPMTADMYSSPADLYSSPFAAPTTQFNSKLL